MRILTQGALALFLCVVINLLHTNVNAQSMSVNAQGNRPDSSAMLDIQSVSKGFLMPRMTKAQRQAILNPAQALMVFQRDAERGFYIYDTAFAAWDHILDSLEIKMLIDSLGNYGIDSVLSLGNNAAGHGIYNLDSLVIGDTTGNYVLHVQDTSSNLLVNASFGTGLLITSKFNPRIYMENQSHSDSNRLMSLDFDTEEMRFGSLTNNGQVWLNQNVLTLQPKGRVGINQATNSTARLSVFRSAMDSTDFGANHSTIYAYRGGNGLAAAGGSSWSNTGIDAAIKGYTFWGNNYTAGVAGYSYLDYSLSAGVLGSDVFGTTWTALAYNSGTYDWGIYSPSSAYLGGFLNVNSTQDSLHRINALRSANLVTNDFGPGFTTIYGYRGGTNGAANGGSSWHVDSIDAAVKGESFWGNSYTAGIAGYNYNDYGISAGVIGSQYSGTYWGALGYKDSTLSTWGVYTPNQMFVGDRLSIGGTVPNAALSIESSLGDLTSGLNLKDSVGNDWYMFQDAAQGLRFRDDAVDVVTITSAGDVGIGTVSPSEKLQVTGPSILSNTRFESGTFLPGVSNATSTVVVIDVAGALGNYWNAEIRVTGQSGTEQSGAVWLVSKPNLGDDVYFHLVTSYTTSATYLTVPTIAYNATNDQITITKPASALSSGVTVFFVHMESQAYSSVHPSFN
ncbi:MAG: hypothetical protein HQ500_03165 [Flavobacteriales bacterium]|nr:hypothetical protein [Flavobacteriales bacterium]